MLLNQSYKFERTFHKITKRVLNEVNILLINSCLLNSKAIQ